MSVQFIFDIPDELIDLSDIGETFLSVEVIKRQRKKKLMTIEDARKMNNSSINSQLQDIIRNLQNVKRKDDGFVPGFQSNINEHHTCYGSYKRSLKEKGLVEIGYDYKPVSSERIGAYLEGENFVNMVNDIAPGEFSDNELDAIRDGKYLDSSKCDLGSE